MRGAHRTAAIAVAVALSAVTGSADAQPYPTRSIRIVVPATPGGAIDTIAQLVADKMTVSMGQSVVVENKPGASNNLGTDFVAKSPPDGYNLVIVASSHATNKFIFNQLPYDPVTDFEPVVFTHVVPLLLAVHPAVSRRPTSEGADCLDQGQPGQGLVFATSGKGELAPHGGRTVPEHGRHQNDAARALPRQHRGASRPARRAHRDDL